MVRPAFTLLLIFIVRCSFLQIAASCWRAGTRFVAEMY